MWRCEEDRKKKRGRECGNEGERESRVLGYVHKEVKRMQILHGADRETTVNAILTSELQHKLCEYMHNILCMTL